VTDTAKIVARILRRRKERNLWKNVEKMSWDMKSKRTLIVISQPIVGRDGKLCACFIEW
jgi:hypothetical protein